MDLINDIHLVTRRNGRKHDLIRQATNMVHTVMGGRVNLVDVHQGAIVRGSANLTLIARVAIFGIQTINRFRENLRKRGLTRPPRTRKQKGMRKTAINHALTKRKNNLFLRDHFAECLGSP